MTSSSLACLALVVPFACSACAAGPGQPPVSSAADHREPDAAVPAPLGVALAQAEAALPTAQPDRFNADPASSSALRDREANQLARTWGWVLVGMGGVAASFALGTSVLMLEDKSTRDSGCNAAKRCTPSAFMANDALVALTPWNTASWIAAAALLGGGAFLLFTHPSDRAAGLGVALQAGGARLTVRGAF